MSKFALVFIAVFLLIEVRDRHQTLTKYLIVNIFIQLQFAMAGDFNLFDRIKASFEETFSGDNMKKVATNLNEFADKAKEFGIDYAGKAKHLGTKLADDTLKAIS